MASIYSKHSTLHEFMCQTVEKAQLDIADELHCYVLCVLQENLHNVSIGNTSLGIAFMEAQHMHSFHKVRALREIADTCLLISGLFSESARHVSPFFYMQIGQSSYNILSELSDKNMAMFYQYMAHDFERAVELLLHMRCQSCSDVDFAKLARDIGPFGGCYKKVLDAYWTVSK